MDTILFISSINIKSALIDNLLECVSSARVKTVERYHVDTRTRGLQRWFPSVTYLCASRHVRLSISGWL